MDLSLGIMIHHLHRIISREKRKENTQQADYFSLDSARLFILERELFQLLMISWCFQDIKTVISIREKQDLKKRYPSSMDFPSYSFLFVCQMFGFKEPQDALKVLHDWRLRSLHSSFVKAASIFKLILKVTFLLKT